MASARTTLGRCGDTYPPWAKPYSVLMRLLIAKPFETSPWTTVLYIGPMGILHAGAHRKYLATAKASTSTDCSEALSNSKSRFPSANPLQAALQNGE